MKELEPITQTRTHETRTENEHILNAIQWGGVAKEAHLLLK